MKGTQNGSHAKPATAEGCEKKQSDKGLRGHIGDGDCFAYIVRHASGRGVASPRPNGRRRVPFRANPRQSGSAGCCECDATKSVYLILGGVARNILREDVTSAAS